MIQFRVCQLLSADISPVAAWRNFASAAAAASQHRASNISAGRRPEIKVSRLANGVSVASVEGGGPVSRVGLAFRAGSRYEAADQRALAHRLRNCVGLGTANMSQTQILHQVAFVGAALQATLTKDLLFSEIDVLRDYLETGLQVVAETGSQTSFPRWVVADTDLHLDMDVHDYLHDHPRRLLDMAHRAAYRTGGLANELIGVFDGQPGHFTAAELSRFASRLVSGEAALVGLNVDHVELVRFATDYLPVVSGQALSSPSHKADYRGGDFRHEVDTDLAHVAVLGQGAGLNNVKSAAVQAVLASLLGTGPSLSYSGSNGLGLASQAADKVGAGQPFVLSSLTAVHSDSGLVGLYLAAPNSAPVRDLLVSSLNAARGLAKGVDAAHLMRAKNQAKMNVLLSAENRQQLLAYLAAQVLATGTVESSADMVKLIESVTANDVQHAAKAAFEGPLSVAALGRIENVPYADEL